MVKKLWYRFYSDFLMPSRLHEYALLIEKSIDSGYEVHSVESFWDEIKKNFAKTQKYLILRHDIDTDIKTANAIFNIEKSLGVKGSYYFRLNTLDIELMQRINEYGSEASYHYELLHLFLSDNLA